MNVFTVLKRDLAALIRKPMLLVSFIAVAFIPILYSGVLVTASWDPYGHLERLPVAVVNLDHGAKLAGKQLKAGEDFINELRQNKSFDWRFVSPGQAEEGMAHNKYYMTVTIPADFSAKAATLMDADPQPASIEYEPNGDYNFIGGQIGSSAVKDLRAELSAGITSAYTRSVFERMTDISNGFKEAGNGAERLNAGAGKLGDGVALLKRNLEKLAAGGAALQNGLAPLQDGAGQLAKGTAALDGSAAKLASGLGELRAAGRKLEAGAASSAQGAAKLQGGLQSSAGGAARLKEGLASSAAGADKLAEGLRTSQAGAEKLASGLRQSEAGSAKVAAGADGVAQGLEKLGAANPELAASAEFKQLLAASKQVASGSAELASGGNALAAAGASLADGAGQLTAAADKLAGGQHELLQGAGALAGGQQQLLGGAQQLAGGTAKLAGGMTAFGGKLAEAADGGSRLASGAAELAGGAAKLAGGLDGTAGGVGSLAGGAAKLGSGASQLATGASELKSGSGELAGKLIDAAGRTAEVRTTDKTVDMFANPVRLVENGSHKVGNYGMGIAPYFLSLGLFVGALIFTTVFNARENAVPGASRLSRFVGKTVIFAGMSAAQSCIASSIMLYGVGLHVHSVPAFLLFTLAASLTFTLIIQTLVTWLDQTGRFIAVLLLILQLTASAGTFPLELLPGWMKPIHPLLPMTHSIDGYKAIIASGDIGAAWQQAGVLAVIAAGALLLTAGYYAARRDGRADDGSRADADAKPSVV